VSGTMEKMSSPIFVVGAPRSGTTLTARILGKHSRIFMVGETHFFEDIYSRRQELGDPSDPKVMEIIIKRLSTIYQRYGPVRNQPRVEKLFSDPSIMKELKSSCKCYYDILSFFIKIQMECYEGKVRWVNDVPRDIFHIKEVLSFYPDAKVIVCVRDSRDFILSYKNLWKATGPSQSLRMKNLFHPIITSMLWKSSIKQISIINPIIQSNNFMMLHYEDLVNNSEMMIKSICKFVEEEFEEQMLYVDSHNSSFSQKGQGIFSTSVGRWRNQLSAEEAYLVQKITHKELERLGYKVEYIKVNPFKVAEIMSTLPYALWRALYANKMHRGPLVPYLVRRVRALIS
jgi:hypothetical protein